MSMTEKFAAGPDYSTPPPPADPVDFPVVGDVHHHFLTVSWSGAEALDAHPGTEYTDECTYISQAFHRFRETAFSGPNRNRPAAGRYRCGVDTDGNFLIGGRIA